MAEAAGGVQAAPEHMDDVLAPYRPERIGEGRARLNLFMAGFVILFLELACIRWFAAQVIFLQFFTNIVLIAAFVGMSIGCLVARSKTDWLNRFPWLALLAIGSALVLNVLHSQGGLLAVEVGNQQSPDVVFFGTELKRADLAQLLVPMEVLAAAFFGLITLLFIGPG